MKRNAAAPGLIIVCDTREKQKHGSVYSFDGLCPSIREKLDVGDYSVAQHTTQISFERKTIPDLFSTIIGARDRFERELERARGFEFFAILIEGSLRDVHSYRCRHWQNADGSWLTEEQAQSRCKTVINSLNSWSIEYGVRVLYVDRDRNMCRTMVLRLAERFWRRKHPPEKKIRTPRAESA